MKFLKKLNIFKRLKEINHSQFDDGSDKKIKWYSFN